MITDRLLLGVQWLDEFGWGSIRMGQQLKCIEAPIINWLLLNVINYKAIIIEQFQTTGV